MPFRLMVLLLLVMAAACNDTNNDTSTDMPDGGYEERTSDSLGNVPGASTSVPDGAVAIDSVKNGRFNVSGVQDTSVGIKDSAANK